MPRKTKDNYSLKISLGKQKVIDLSSLEEGAYNRLRQKVSVHQRETGQKLITRKEGNKVTIFRIK